MAESPRSGQRDDPINYPVLHLDLRPPPVDIAQSATLFILGGVLLALLVGFGVAPPIVARDNLRLWHGVGTAMYVVQWLCATVIFLKLSRQH